MQTSVIEFFSEGRKLVGICRTPDAPSVGPWPVIVQPPGFLGLAEGPVSELYHNKFTAAGFAVLSADYRGFGESEGERGWINPGQQLEDLLNLVTYATTRDDLDSPNIFCYGHGGTGGGNAIMLASTDDRIRAVAAQTAVADGVSWLRSMRRESEWRAYLRRLEANERERVLHGVGELVDPREEIMVATPERKRESTRAYADKRLSEPFHLASATMIMRYRPVDMIAKIAPRPVLLIALEGDVVTPPDLGAEALFRAAGSPKKIIRQRGNVSHYDAYKVNLDRISGEVIEWLRNATCKDSIEVEAQG